MHHDQAPPLLRHAALRRLAPRSATTSARCCSGASCRTTYDAIFCVVDLHAITVPQDPAKLREATRAHGRAVHRRRASTRRRRSCSCSRTCPRTRELAWVLNTITGFGEASRMTQFKDKSAKQGADAASVGLFTYPILQAADILLYDADDRAGRRRPAAARRADPRPRRSASTRGSATRSSMPEVAILERDREDLRPAEPDVEDVEVGRQRRRASSGCSTSRR